MMKGMMLPAVVGACYRDHGLVAGKHTVAVAFSGGADSVALLAASRMAGYECVALHCNFHLRGAESDRDEAFARAMAMQLGCGIRVCHFDVDARRAATGESVEMACRELRYDWFEKEYAAADGAWGGIAVGHHADDNVETFFLNLLRGSGLRGLGGIAPQRGIFLRPMLGVGRTDILSFLKSEGLDFVVDSSNLSDDYRRNKLRNNILPVMERDFPQMRAAVSVTMDNLRRDSCLLGALLERERGQVVSAGGVIDLRKITCMPQGATFLYHMLNMSSDGAVFGLSTAEAILRSADESGRVFHADAGDAAFLLDRGRLIPLSGEWQRGDGPDEEVDIDFGIRETGGRITEPLPLFFERLRREDFAPGRDASVIWLDYDAIRGERLFLRRWRKGDRFQPFGMKGSRLVSDVMSDARLSLLDKNQLWLLCAGDRILWIPGVRASRHFPVNASTRNILRISVQKTSKTL